MFTIEVPNKFSQANGKPWRKQKEDVNGKPLRVKGEDGKPVEPPEFETEDAAYTDMLKFFLNNVFALVDMAAKENKEIKRLQLEDSAHATDIFRAINVSNGKIELEKSSREWLEKMLSQHGTLLFGVNTAVMLEPIKGGTEGATTRAERRRN